MIMQTLPILSPLRVYLTFPSLSRALGLVQQPPMNSILIATTPTNFDTDRKLDSNVVVRVFGGFDARDMYVCKFEEVSFRFAV